MVVGAPLTVCEHTAARGALLVTAVTSLNVNGVDVLRKTLLGGINEQRFQPKLLRVIFIVSFLKKFPINRLYVDKTNLTPCV